MFFNFFSPTKRHSHNEDIPSALLIPDVTTTTQHQFSKHILPSKWFESLLDYLSLFLHNVFVLGWIVSQARVQCRRQPIRAEKIEFLDRALAIVVTSILNTKII